MSEELLRLVGPSSEAVMTRTVGLIAVMLTLPKVCVTLSIELSSFLSYEWSQ